MWQENQTCYVINEMIFFKTKKITKEANYVFATTVNQLTFANFRKVKCMNAMTIWNLDFFLNQLHQINFNILY